MSAIIIIRDTCYIYIYIIKCTCTLWIRTKTLNTFPTLQMGGNVKGLGSFCNGPLDLIFVQSQIILKSSWGNNGPSRGIQEPRNKITCFFSAPLTLKMHFPCSTAPLNIPCTQISFLSGRPGKCFNRETGVE